MIKKILKYLPRKVAKSLLQWLPSHLLTIVCCVLIVGLGVVFLVWSSPGTTTIGENISTGNITASGNLEVGGNATTSGNLNLGGDLDLNLNQLKEGVLERLSHFPSTATTGQMFWSTATSVPYWYDDSEWQKPSPRTATIVVAASDSSTSSKRRADYVCDGTDDQVEIQAAIDEVVSNGGGKVFITNGTYILSSRLALSYATRTDVPLVIEGESWNAVLKHDSGVNFDRGMLYVYRANQVIVRNITFDGNKDNVPTHTDRFKDNNVYFEEVKYGRVENVLSKNSFMDGIIMHKGVGGWIVGNFLYNCGKTYGMGITLHGPGPDRYFVVNNYLYDSGPSQAIEVHTANESVVYGNIIEYYYVSPKNGITNAGEGRGLIISENVIRSATGATIDNGISLSSNIGDSEETIIADNYLYDVQDGIVVSSDDNKQTNITITNNMIRARRYGIRVYEVSGAIETPSNVTVANNRILGQTGADTGIKLDNLNTGQVFENFIDSSFSTALSKGNVTDISIKDNQGYTTENSGIAILPAGSNSTTVDHGLAGTPSVVTANAATSTVGAVSITNKNSTSFTITTEATTTSDVEIYWKAEM